MPVKRKPKGPRKVLSIEALPVTEATVFNGKAFALERERYVASKVGELKSFGIKPKLVAILTQEDPASMLYIKLKKKAAERVGMEFEVYELLSSSRNFRYLINLIVVLNHDESIHGIMIQLPLAKRFKAYQTRILNTIAPEKDVDGLRTDTTFTPATVRAVISIIEEASLRVLLRKPPPVMVVGAKGAVGAPLVKALKEKGYSVNAYDKKPTADWRDTWGVPSFMSLKADVIVSATGTPGLIEARHVAKGAAVIDVGSPVGDVRFREVKEKASFITPVPGGVGPVTIVSLLENTLDATYKYFESKQNKDL